MYVRVQLGEEPVWERRAEDTSAKNIVLLEEGRAKKQASDMDKDMDKGNGKGKGKERESDSSTELAGQLENLDLDRSNALALERGDSAPASKGGRVDVQIREKERVLPASVRSPQLRQDDREGGSVEGYVPQKHRARDSTDEEDILDQF